MIGYFMAPCPRRHDGAMIKPALYSYWCSSWSWRVRTALAWKAIDHEYKAVHLINQGGEHKLEGFTKINPNQVRKKQAKSDTLHPKSK